MLHLRFILSALILICVAGARPALAAGKEVIGYVNISRAIHEVEEGKRTKARLEAIHKKKQAALTEREKELEELKTRLEKRAPARDDPKARAEVLEFQKKLLALRETYLKERNELQKLEIEALSKITKKLRRIVEEIGKRGDYTLIMEAQESSIMFAKPHLDLTNEVIRKYNARFGVK